jgi:hypothetical protein
MRRLCHLLILVMNPPMSPKRLLSQLTKPSVKSLLGLILLGMAVLGSPKVSPAREQTVTFGGQDSLAGWTITGDVTVDAAKKHVGPGSSLRLGPGGRAFRKLSDADLSGKVEFWTFEDGVVDPKPKEHGYGALWGLVSKDGKAVVAGAIYAPYLDGGESYAIGDFEPGDSKDLPSYKVQYVGLKRAGVGWHKWTFDLDPAKGLTISCDGQAITRFDWNLTRLTGIGSLAFFGAKNSQQVLWIDELTITLGPLMKTKPTPPRPQPPVVPETDPAPETPVNLVEAVRGKHPRLLFSAEDVPAMKRLALGEGTASKGTPQLGAPDLGRKMFETLLGYLPPSRNVPPDSKFTSDDTEAQRQGMWRLPTVALHYVLTGDRRSFDSCLGYMKKFLATEHWQTDQELDSGMGAANVMVGAALVYDWLYHDLDPEFREAYAKKLLLQARRMYYGGHLNRNHDIGYWQQDPQNNHRWHRDAGLALCVLGVADDLPGTEFIVAKTLEELKFVNQWLPPDGTCHESPSYMIFGGPYLVLASQAADRCLGSSFLGLPYYRNNAAFRIQTLAPGMNDVFGYGDFGGFGFINNFLFKEAGVARDRDLQAAIMRFYDAQGAEAFMYGWFSLIWYDPSLAGGAFKMPNRAYYEDLGLAFLRDGWSAENVGVMFKCGPYGGYKLNEYRNANGYHGINVAHDDPDANTFDLYARGQMLVQDGGYAAKKLSSSVNTILVNGRGQKGEGEGWTQPLRGPDSDMTKLAHLLAWKSADTLSVVEGEAAGAYADLTRYRRTIIFAPAGYVMILDDIRAAKEVEVTWLAQSPRVQAVDETAHRFRLVNRDTACDVQMASDRAFAVAIGVSTAESHGRSAGWQQLQVKAKGTAWRLATVFNAWNHRSFDVALEPSGDNAAIIRVTAGEAVADTWTWAAAPSPDIPSSLKCRRKEGSTFECGPADTVSPSIANR